jgi:ADP-heptose:LPS heptosyltransferase
MRRLFLLRAYGDFVIAVRSAILSADPKSIKIIASNHLYPLFEAMSSVIDTSQLDISFEDFGIHLGQLNLFTNRHMLEKSTLEQARKIKKYLIENPSNHNGLEILEQSRKKGILQLITGKKFESIVNNDPVYQEYAHFFGHESNSKFINDNIEKKHFLLLPDARISKRNIPQEIIQSIIKEVNQRGASMQVAYFKRVSQVNKTGRSIKVQMQTDLIFNQTVYNNFKELIQLIQEADFIIGADSLPIHLSQLLNKKHFILYPSGGSKAFFTPYTVARQYYCEFNKYQSTTIPY